MGMLSGQTFKGGQDSRALSTGQLVDSFSPQHMPFRYRTPGFADAGFLGELSHGSVTDGRSDRP
jgi:hypothetical protein